MAIYSAVSAVHKVLSASVVDTVTLTGRAGSLEVLNRSSSDTLYFRLDGTSPTVGGDNARAVPPMTAWEGDAPDTKDKVVKLISSGNAPYSVQGEFDEADER